MNKRTLAGATAAIVAVVTGAVVLNQPEPRIEITAPRTFIYPGNTTGWSAQVKQGNKVVTGGKFKWESNDSGIAVPVRPASGFIMSFRPGEAVMLVTWVKGADSLCAWKPMFVAPPGSPRFAIEDSTRRQSCSEAWPLGARIPAPVRMPRVFYGGDTTIKTPCAKGWTGYFIRQSNDTAFFLGREVRPDSSRSWCIPYNMWVVEDSGKVINPDSTIGYMRRVIPPTYHEGEPGYKEGTPGYEDSK